VCGRGYETYTDDDLAFLSSNGQPPSLEWLRQNFNLVSIQDSPVVVMRNGTRTFDAFRWGLVPFWVKTVQPHRSIR
jgi:putative SOS response-associated peptidase YedK